MSKEHEKIEALKIIIKDLVEDADERDGEIEEMEKKVAHLSTIIHGIAERVDRIGVTLYTTQLLVQYQDGAIKYLLKVTQRPVSGSFTIRFGGMKPSEIGDTHMQKTVVSGQTYALSAVFNGLDAAGMALTGAPDAGGTYSVTGGSSTVQQAADGSWGFTAGAAGDVSTVTFSGAFAGFAATGSTEADVADVPVAGQFTVNIG